MLLAMVLFNVLHPSKIITRETMKDGWTTEGSINSYNYGNYGTPAANSFVDNDRNNVGMAPLASREGPWEDRPLEVVDFSK